MTTASVENSTATPKPPAVGVPPPAPGSPPWKAGDWAITACVGGPRHVYIMSVGEKRADVFTLDGVPTSEHLGYLLSVEGYIDHANRMADEWTGKEYRENIERARRVPPLHPDWPKWLAFALDPAAIDPKANTKLRDAERSL